ncbi:hypothetical protein EGW08_017501, partial [Elysia chlorotica]
NENIGVNRSPLEVVLISIVVTLLAIVTSGGNLLVIVAFKIDKNLQTVSNYFLLSLAVADLTIGIVSMPLYTVYLLMGYWPLKAIMCDIWLSLDYTMSNASVANLIIISVDRYLSVTRPLTYRAKRTPRRAATMIGFAWVISSVMWTPWIFAWPKIEGKRSVPDNECYIQFLTTNQYITVITAMFAFYIPVIIMSVLYFQIYRETQKRQKDLPKLQGMHKKSKKLKQHPHQPGHQASKKSMASSDEEAQSSTSDRGNNFIVHTNGMEKAASRDSQQGASRNRLLGCIKIDRDSDYMEDSSSSEQPGSPPSSHSQAHIHGTVSQLGLPRSNGSKQQLPRQDSENSTNSLQVTPLPQASGVSYTGSFANKPHWSKPSRSVRINFSTSLIPLLSTNSPSPTGNGQSHECPYTSVDTMSFSPDDQTTSPLGDGGLSDYSLTSPSKYRDSNNTSACHQAGDRNFQPSGGLPNFSNSESSLKNESKSSFKTSLGKSRETERNEEEEEDDEEEDVEMYRVLIRMPLLSDSGEEQENDEESDVHQAMEAPRPSIVVEREDDMDAFSERNPGMVQRAESDTEDEEDLSRCLKPLDRPSLPPPVRPPTGTPALARRAQSNDSVKVAQQVKIATKAATRARKARQVASVAQAKVQSRHQERRQDQKAAKTLTAILLAFIITWTPYNIFAVVKVFCNGCVNETIYAIGYWMCYINSTINPLCYALCNVNFRRTFWRILTCRCAPRRGSLHRMVLPA